VNLPRFVAHEALAVSGAFGPGDLPSGALVDQTGEERQLFIGVVQRRRRRDEAASDWLGCASERLVVLQKRPHRLAVRPTAP
jgi:hypothetical protein